MTSLERLLKRTGDDDLELLSGLLDSAESVILARRYPFGGGELEERYRDLQFRIALAMYNKLGAEYETSHSESGISRTWGSEDVPQQLLEEIVPIGKVAADARPESQSKDDMVSEQQRICRRER